ncbi:MAG: hypothetical protein DMG89_06400 [Acidobacteria bacterium]|nr:MAG: hypothetical protein DMG89_06400 [Acidobacteriota bacterium]
MRSAKLTLKGTIALCLFLLLCSTSGLTYSVLTHEQVIDILWNDPISPLLRRRYPKSTEEDLRKAHAYAYGGCVLQDMGYYPFGSKYFSDLVHYVRSGDFVQALLRDAGDLNEYAFALGALAHYASDISGHPTINRITAIEFPKLQRKFGNEVTYADDHKAHIQTEFGFDMVQVAKNRYTSDHYHDFIGFEVAKPVLERAFLDTYDLKLEDVFGDVDLAIGSYRRGVSQMIPGMTRVALLSRGEQIVKDTPNFDQKKFLYLLSRAQYEKEWGTIYRKPGLGTRILAFFLKIMPKFGPFRAAKFKIPTQQTEDMYIKSVNETVDNFSRLLAQASRGELDLPNRDFDTGRETRAGEYVLTDQTYARLVHDLVTKNPGPLPPALRQDILHFYSDDTAPIATKKKPKSWQMLREDLEKLKSQSAETPAQEHGK